MKNLLQRLYRWFVSNFAPIPPTVYVYERFSPGVGPLVLTHPEVCVDQEDWQRMWCYIEECPEEISGLAHVDYDPEGNSFRLHSHIMLPQEVSVTETDLDPVSMGKLVHTMVTQGHNPVSLKLWWHSHAGGSVFWSKHQDEVTIRSLGQFGIEYLISFVGNHRNDFLCRIDIFSPVRVTIDNVPVRILNPEDGELRTRIRQEITDKVTFKGGKKVYV